MCEIFIYPFSKTYIIQFYLGLYIPKYRSNLNVALTFMSLIICKEFFDLEFRSLMIIVCVTTLNCHDFLINGNIVKRSIRRPVRLTVALKAVPWLRSLVAGLSPRVPGFAPGSIRVGFVADKVALGQVFLRVLRFSPVIPPSLSKLIFWGMRNVLM
jgi:hypothetical protein